MTGFHNSWAFIACACFCIGATITQWLNSRIIFIYHNFFLQTNELENYTYFFYNTRNVKTNMSISSYIFLSIFWHSFSMTSCISKNSFVYCNLVGRGSFRVMELGGGAWAALPTLTCSPHLQRLYSLPWNFKCSNTKKNTQYMNIL